MPSLAYCNAQTSPPLHCAVAILDPRERDGKTRRLDRRVFAFVVVIVLAIFAGLYNRWWVPGGDGDFYLVIARNIAAGHGIRFNGLRIAIEPPGWPILLAGAMKISTSFAFLKWFNVILLTLFLAMSYWIVRRLVSRPWVAAAIVIGTALLSNVYEISYWFHSDPLFCVVTAATFLAAFHIREGRTGGWRVPLLLVLCIASVGVRYAGLLNWPIVAAILVSGHIRPLWSRAWFIAILAGIVLLGTYLGLSRALSLSKNELKVAKESGAFIDESVRSETQSYDENVIRTHGRPSTEVTEYLTNAGHWLSWLFFEPLRMAGLPGNALTIVIGYLAIALLGVQVYRSLSINQCIWLGVATPCMALILLWPSATARYLVPLSPLILTGILAPLAGPIEHALFGRIGRFLLYSFIVAAVLCNLSLYCVECWIFHQRDFYGAYYAGIDKTLIEACHYLRVLGAGDNETVISNRYENMGRVHNTRFGMRAAALLIDRDVILIPPNVNAGDSVEPPLGPFVRWAHTNHVHYFLRQSPISPWRWHFSLEWLQRLKQKTPIEPTPSDWQIWDISGDTPVQIPFPPLENWPTHVPGV